MQPYIFFGFLTLGAFLIWFDGKQKTKNKNRHASKKKKKDWFEMTVITSDWGKGKDSCE